MTPVARHQDGRSERQADIQELSYSLGELSTWVQRPQAIAKCFVSDVYALKSLIPVQLDPTKYSGRDVYLLDRWPCRMVETVAWVAGVDHKEKTMIITVDDGDGQYVLPVAMHLPSRQAPKPTLPKVSATSTDTFLTKGERKAMRKQAEIDTKLHTSRETHSTYVRQDIRVGDAVRVVGKVNEYARRKQEGLEWVRELVVDEGSGGSVAVVDEDEQYSHTSMVIGLHHSTYSKPFILPVFAPPPSKILDRSTITASSCPSSPSYTFSELASSEIGELDLVVGEVELREPSKLRSSQLTDATFRQYALDYMSRETLRYVEACTDPGDCFPEYIKDKIAAGHGTSSRSMRRAQSSSVNLGPTFASYTPSNLLDSIILNELAGLVVDTVARKEEKRRRRRIQEGVPRKGDLEIDVERRQTGRDWRLTKEERSSRMERLVAWVIRDLHQDGCIVHLNDGYIPLPPELLYPLLIPHIERETFLREGVFMRKGDPRRDNGVTSDELIKRLHGWGVDGRWERIQAWVVDDALQWAEQHAHLRSKGKGWELVHRA